MFTKTDLLADITFLSKRAELCGCYEANPSRSYGKFANALVRFAYGGRPPGDNEKPYDNYDLLAAGRAMAHLPKHRLSIEVQDIYLRETKRLDEAHK